MRKVVNVTFIMILVLFAGYIIYQYNCNRPEEVEPTNTIVEPTGETITLPDGSTITTGIQSDGSMITAETLEDGTLLITQSKEGEEPVVNMYASEKVLRMEIPSDVCPKVYTVTNNEEIIILNATNEKPLDAKEDEVTCYDDPMNSVYQIESGTYSEFQIKSESGSYFEIIEPNDIVNITINGTTYTLDDSNPRLTIDIEVGDEIIVESTNPLGVYFESQVWSAAIIVPEE